MGTSPTVWYLVQGKGVPMHWRRDYGGVIAQMMMYHYINNPDIEIYFSFEMENV
jgi:hypothetical protein